MSKRLAWLLGLVVLVSIAFLVACGSKYSASSDGLVLIASQGSNQIQSFSFNLGNGHISGISNPPGTANIPSSMVLDPAGAYAYVIIAAPPMTTFQCGSNSAATAGIQSFKVNSDGTLTAGDCTPDINSDPNSPIRPVFLAMDAAGKFLFEAEGLHGVVYSYSIASGGSLTLVPGTYTLPPTLQTPNLVALAPTPTTLPGSGLNGTQIASCSTSGNPPTSQYLYAVDAVNNLVWQFSVDTSTGALGNPPNQSVVATFGTGSVPSGVAVDACDRFVYVANNQSNNISAYGICTGSNPPEGCAALDGTLKPILGSPFTIGSGSGPGPVVIDPFGNFLYVVFTRSNQVAPFHISSVSGTLTAGTPQATGRTPTAVAIRADDNWLFVTNNQDGTLSQYSITPASGGLNSLPTVQTDTFPWGVAVK